MKITPLVNSRFFTSAFLSLLLTLLGQSFSHSSIEHIFESKQTQSKIQKPANRILSVKQIEGDLKLLKEAYSRIHPGYTRYTDEQTLDEAWNNILIKARENKGMSVGNFYLAIQEWLTLIKCDHTKANLPQKLSEERNNTPVYLPFRWVWLEDRAFITLPPQDESQASPEQAKAQAKTQALLLEKFDEIVSIDGRPIKNMVEQVKAYIPYDGYTKWARRSGVSESLEFKGGALDHFGAFLWDIKPDAKVTVKKQSGEIQMVKVKRINHKQWLTLITDPQQARNFKDAVSYKAISKQVAYLKVDSFVNYRDPVDVEDIYDPVFKAIQDQRHKVLIVDLRNNGGGSTDASRGLLANLITQKAKFKLDMFAKTLSFEDIREHLWTWDKRALDPYRIAFRKNDNGTYTLRSFFTEELDTVKPAKYAFKGQIITLTSNNNASASTNLLSVLHSLRDTILIGEKTGGSSEGVTAGLLFTLTLPESKISSRLPFFGHRNNVKSFEKGMGLSPDMYAPMTVEAFLKNRDPSLEAAIAYADAM